MSNKDLYQSWALFLLGIAFPLAHSFVFPKVSKFLRAPVDLHTSLKLDPSVSLTPFQEALGIATRDAAWKAGEVIRAGLGSINVENGVESKIGSRDIVTKVDKESQEIIRSVILSYFPTHKFLGEEDVPPGIEASKAAMERFKDEEHLWIVDPVDGTTNFAHGMPLCAVIICYASYGEILHGFIYDPFREESFYTWKGKGAYMNGQRLRCCDAESLSTSVIVTGSPPNIPALNACLRGFVHLSPQVRSMRCLGAAAICLTWTAMGRLTAYFEADLNAWDAAAGALLVQEAGGRVSDVWGNAFQLTTRNVVCSNANIHAALLQELQTCEMWIKEEEEK